MPPPEVPPPEVPPPPAGVAGPFTPGPYCWDPADDELNTPACARMPLRASTPATTAAAAVTRGERAADRAGPCPRITSAAAPATTTASRTVARPSGNRTGSVMPAYTPAGRPTVLDTTQVATTTRLPAAPSASHHRGARTRATAPHTICAAATTAKNARFSALVRPTVAAAAMLIAPAAMLARAMAVRTRAGFLSGSAPGPLADTGRGVAVIT